MVPGKIDLYYSSKKVILANQLVVFKVRPAHQNHLLKSVKSGGIGIINAVIPNTVLADQIS